MKQLHKHLLCVAIAAALMHCAHAQESTDDDSANRATELGTVTVTARGLDESLQEVPLPISAVSEETIKARGLQDVRDIANFTPGFSFRSGFGRIGDRPVIRGMSNIQGQPNASFFIDGVFVSGSISGYNLDNLERVEVIRGPQSAQFGRRTFSGAVNYVTRRPGDEIRASGVLGFGQDGYTETKAMWSGPVVPGLLAFEANAGYSNIDGRFFNQVSGKEDIGGESTQYAGLVVSFRPSDSLDVLLRTNFVKNDDDHPAIFRQGSALNNCFLPTLTGGNIGPFPAANSRRRGYFCGTTSVPDTFGVNTPQFEQAGYPAGLEREAVRVSLNVEWTLPNSWTLRSVSAYNDTEVYSAIDQDFSSLRGFGGAFETFDQSRGFDYSQELRLASDTENAVSWQVGAYYYRETAGDGFSGSLAGFGFAPNSPRPIANLTSPTDETVNRALFGMLDWRITDRWRAALEVRYAEDEVSAGGVQRTTLNIGGTQTAFVREFQFDEIFTSTTPRVSLSYQASDDLMVFGLVSKGTKPGGFNTAVQNPVLTDAARSELLALGFDRFTEEQAINYELGFKSDWMDGNFRLNGSLFFIDWDDQQLTETRAVNRVDGLQFITSFTTNLGQSEIIGLELESFWQLSDSVLVNFSYTYLDTEIKEYFSQDQADLFDGNASAAGNELPRVPKNSATLGLTWDGEFDGGWGWFAGADAFYEGSRYSQIHNLAETGDSTVANFRIGVRPTDRITVTAFVRNAFDEDAPEDVLRYINPAQFISVPQVPGFPGRQVTNVRDFAITAQSPRMWGLQLRYDY